MPEKLPRSGARQPGLCWRCWWEDGSGEHPGMGWPEPAHVETEQELCSQRKELLGKASITTRPCTMRRREPGSAEPAQVVRAGEPVFSMFSPFWDQSPPQQIEAVSCSAGEVHVRSLRAARRLEGKSVQHIQM